MEKLLMFSENGEEILAGYEKLSKGIEDERYPALKNEDLYVLKAESKEKLEGVIARPLLASFALSDEKTADGIKAGIISAMPEEQRAFLADASLTEILKMLPDGQRAMLLSEMSGKLEAMGESMIGKAAVQAVRREYEAVGLDTGALQMNYIVRTGLKMLLFAFVAAACVIIVGFLGSRISALMAMEMRRDVYHKVMDFSNGEMDKFSTASLITRTTNDIQQVQMLILMMIRMVLYAPIVGIGGIFKVINAETTMSWIIAVALGAMLMLVIVMFLFTMPRFKIMQKLVDRLNLVTREILTGLPVIRAFSTEKYEEKRFDSANVDLTRTNLFVNRVMVCMMPTMMLIMNLITVLIVWVGGNAMDSGTVQVGDMMAFIQYTMQIVMAFLMISMISVMLPRAAVSVTRISEVLNTEESIKEPDAPAEFKSGINGRLEFSHVDFAYPNADEKALEDISFVAESGKTTAIIGSTGSGKSTLLNLIPRLYDVTGGEILLDGADIRTVSVKELRDKLGCVPQKGILFTGTIDSNLRYGRPGASSEEIEKAAEIAQAKEFIEEKPEGYETPIAQGEPTFPAVRSKDFLSQEPSLKNLKFIFSTTAFPLWTIKPILL